MTVLFASDVHLSAARPQQVEAFLGFLEGPCRGADALYLLGDVFDEWLGDDDVRDPHPRVLDALADLSARGVALSFVFGNHDFLASQGFARRTGCVLLDQPARIRVLGTPVVVLHGDQLCTRDTDYQAWRATFTDRAAQQQFLALPFPQRIERAAALRHRSSTLTRLKPEDIMDVTPDAVIDTLRHLDARHMIHGHTHRPAVHRMELDGEPCMRLVLGDWYEGDQVVIWDGAGPRLASATGL